QLAEHVRRIDFELAEDAGQVGVGSFGQFKQPVLDFHAGIGPRKAEPGRRLERVETGLVERLDQSPGIDSHLSPPAASTGNEHNPSWATVPSDRNRPCTAKQSPGQPDRPSIESAIN